MCVKVSNHQKHQQVDKMHLAHAPEDAMDMIADQFRPCVAARLLVLHDLHSLQGHGHLALHLSGQQLSIRANAVMPKRAMRQHANCRPTATGLGVGHAPGTSKYL